MIKQVISTIDRYALIEKGDRIVVGLSGGPDSVCLLHVLHSISDKFQTSLIGVHINHLLRGKESDEDESYVIRLCEQMGVRLFVENIDIKKAAGEQRISLEEAGREARYRIFNQIFEKMAANKIAVAHNKNDQAETILMRMIRGTGIDGLKGMDYKRDNIIRPLLDVARTDIEKYCEENKLNPRTDSSNLQTIYTRNKIRLELIPFINNSFQGDIVDSLNKMSNLLRDDYNLIETFSSELYNQSIISSCKSEIRLNLEKLKGFEPGALKRVLRKAVQEVKGDLKGIESIHIDSLINLIRNGETGSEIYLPGNIRGRRSYGIFKILRINEDFQYMEIFDETINLQGETRVIPLCSSIIAEPQPSQKIEIDLGKISGKSMVQFFDYDKVKQGINIRNRKDGDVFKPYKSNGTKKLKEYFIDSKIPREMRNDIPLVAKNNEIVWVVGYKISDKFKVTENTKVVLKLEYKTE